MRVGRWIARNDSKYWYNMKLMQQFLATEHSCPQVLLPGSVAKDMGSSGQCQSAIAINEDFAACQLELRLALVQAGLTYH